MGVCSHSNDSFWDKFIIFTVDESLIDKLEDFLNQNKISYDDVEGYWKSKKETSYILRYKHFTELKNAGFFESQDTVLLLSGSKRIPTKGKHSRSFARHASLIHKDGSEKYIGWLVQTDKDTALASGDCSYIPSQKTWWHVIKDIE